MGDWLRKWPLFTAGFFLSPVAMYYAIHSGGNGNGDYAAARLGLPLACLFIGAYAAAPWMVLVASFLEWPLYGAVVDGARHKFLAACIIVIVHLAVAAWLFTGGAGTFVQTPQ